MAKATEQLRLDDHKLRWPIAWAAVAFGLLAAAMPARSECLSPSEAAGATTTTVYRCPEADASATKGPVIVQPDKSTVVERGAANVPWFEPKPTQTSDPVSVPTLAAPEKQAVPPEQPEKKLAVPEKKEAPPEPKEGVVNIEPVPDVAEEPKTEATPEEPKATKAEPKKKAAETRKAKPKRKVVKKRSKTKLAKAKRSKPKVAQAKKTKPKAAKPEPTAEQQIKTEPAKSDDKIILMTRKDGTLGKRIKNWLGF